MTVRPHAKDGVADSYEDVALELRREDLHAVDARAVRRARVDDVPARSAARDPTVEARDRGVGDDDVVRFMRADPTKVSLEDELFGCWAPSNSLEHYPQAPSLEREPLVLRKQRVLLLRASDLTAEALVLVSCSRS